MTAIAERMKDLTWYFEELSSDANIEWIKHNGQIIGFIAYKVMTTLEIQKHLELNDEEDFTLPGKDEYLYLEAIEILKPFQDQGHGTIAFLNFQKESKHTIIFQFTDLSECFWEKFNPEFIDGASWWMYL